MNGSSAFLDTNVVLYLLSSDRNKADRAEELVDGGATISVQVLNECVAASRRKLKLPWPEIHLLLGYLRSACRIVATDIDTHDRAVEIAETTGIFIYDALLVATAEAAGCTTFLSEDLNSGQRIGSVTVLNPF